MADTDNGENTEPKTFTQEEVDTIKAESTKEYQGLQKVIAKKDQQLQELSLTQPTVSREEFEELQRGMAKTIDAVAAREEVEGAAKGEVEVIKL